MDQIDAWPLGAIRYGARVIPGFRSARAPFLLAVAVLGVLPASGSCSYIFVTPPRDEGDGITVAGDCSTNIAAPAVDTALVGTNLFSSIYVAGQGNVSDKGQAVGIGVVATAFWLSSAIYGYYYTTKCAALRTDDDPGPRRRPPRLRRTVLSGPPGPLPPPAYPAGSSGGTARTARSSVSGSSGCAIVSTPMSFRNDAGNASAP